LLLSAVCASAQCPLPASVGLRIERVPGGPKMAVWYPTADAETSHAYSRFVTGSVALNGAPLNCERYPLVIFSHGFDGCGTQSVFFTEELARAGYVVAAPDHRDAACSVEGAGLPRLHLPKLSFMNPGRWRESTYRDRGEDLEKVLDWIEQSADFRGIVDTSRIGAAGHSLGGYTVLGLAGGWESWRDPRVKAVLVFSPYVKPFLAHQRLNAIHVPVMYQGAQFDGGITPSLRGAHGAFAESADPKYYVELRHASHFEWTNAVCFGHRRVADCLQKRANARLIVDYGVAFFDRYLKQRPQALESMIGRGLRLYRREDVR
jgi:predicted dienelactone hydrolase